MVRLIIAVVFLVLLSPRANALIIDFDEVPAGSVVTSINGVSFNSNILGYDLITSDYYATTSAPNALGVNDGFTMVFLPGDAVYFSFPIPVTSVSVSFISSPMTPGGVFSINTVLGSSQSGVTPSDVLIDLGEVFNVSFISATPFSEVTFNSLVGDVYSFNIDDIVYSPVPEPGTFLLMGGGLALVVFMRRKLGLSPQQRRLQ